MAMSDCTKCWDTPCRCGHDYAHWTEKDLEDQIKMLQGVLAGKRLAAFRSESDIDVLLQPNPAILQKYNDLVLSRVSEQTIQSDVAKIHDTGFIISTSNYDGQTKVVLVDSGNGYIMPDAAFQMLEVMVGERVTIILHREQYRIIKSPVRIAPIKTELN